MTVSLEKNSLPLLGDNSFLSQLLGGLSPGGTLDLATSTEPALQTSLQALLAEVDIGNESLSPDIIITPPADEGTVFSTASDNSATSLYKPYTGSAPRSPDDEIALNFDLARDFSSFNDLFSNKVNVSDSDGSLLEESLLSDDELRRLFFNGSADARPPSDPDKTLTIFEDNLFYLNISPPSDPDNDITVTQLPSGGVILVSSDLDSPIQIGDGLTIEELESLVFHPSENFNGDAGSFVYEVNDGVNPAVSKTIYFIVNPVNDGAADTASFNLSDINGTNGFVINGIAAEDYSGHSVSSAGDINGDGFDDLLIGAYRADTNGLNSGATYLVYGKEGGYGASFNLSDLNGTNGFVINGIAADDYSGYSVSSAGDINGDGFDDLLIGAYLSDTNGLMNSGATYLVYGKEGGYGASFNLSDINGTNGFVINGIASMDYSGYSVSSAGDINGDGFDDLLIGAYLADTNGSNSGATYLVYGKEGGYGASFNLSDINGTNGFVINGIAADDYSGYSVASAGDINGDGFDDLLIGAQRADTNGLNSGATYLVYGKEGGYGASFNLSDLNGTNGFVISGIESMDYSGYSVSSAGDINGDGFDELLIGAYLADTNVFSGATYLVYGKEGGYDASFNLSDINGTNGFVINGAAPGDFSGYSVSSAGDINGDGFDDLLIGAYQADTNGSNSGATYLVYGKEGGYDASFNLSDINGTNGFVINGIASGDYSGYSVSAAGDINGDGFDDLLIGAERVDTNGLNSGATYLVYGGDEYSSNSFLLGTSEDDIIIGTVGADHIIGAQGNDTLYSKGVADVIYGGAGDDTVFTADASFFKIDGGRGHDILVWDNDGLLDLSALNKSALEGFEGIDLSYNTGDLNLDSLDVLNLSDTSNTVRINGDADNTVTLQGGGWVDSGPVVDGGETYTAYTQGEAVAQIETDIVVVMALS